MTWFSVVFLSTHYNVASSVKQMDTFLDLCVGIIFNLWKTPSVLGSANLIYHKLTILIQIDQSLTIAKATNE